MAQDKVTRPVTGTARARPSWYASARMLVLRKKGASHEHCVCSVVRLNATRTVVLRRRMRRQTVIDFASKLPQCGTHTVKAAE